MLAGTVAAAVARAVRSADPLVARRVPAWTRTNYRGQSVTLTGGLSAALGSLVGTAAGTRGATRRAALLAVTAAAAAGAYDDVVAGRSESPTDKGLRGHLAALREGRVSGGVVKVVVIGSAAVLSAVILTSGSSRGRVLRVGLRALVIAESANMINLLDLRPGRAGKVVAAAGLGLLGGPSGGLAAAGLGATSAVLPDDLCERTMLGDCGANALGALLGVQLAAGDLPLTTATVLGLLTLASERWSFNAVIDSCRPLRAIDRLGRRA
jgi:UDP-N-acetylmuramyl pentapeptide phosphotransferase/UDP-N-acetylglucosamine-1-phosphate transferase